MGRHTIRLLRAEAKSGGKPSREVTDRLREMRVLTEALAAYEAQHRPELQSDDFFATLDARLTALEQMVQQLQESREPAPRGKAQPPNR